MNWSEKVFHVKVSLLGRLFFLLSVSRLALSRLLELEESPEEGLGAEDSRAPKHNGNVLELGVKLVDEEGLLIGGPTNNEDNDLLWPAWNKTWVRQGGQVKRAGRGRKCEGSQVPQTQLKAAQMLEKDFRANKTVKGADLNAVGAPSM